MSNSKQKLFAIDPAKLRDEDVSPWDVFTRPDKAMSAYTAKEVGLQGERLAHVYLERRGYEVLEANWRCPAGEVDLVAQDGDETVLVEVKSSLDLGGGSDLVPELRVDHRKRTRYRRLALFYMADHEEADRVRFDVVAITVVGERLARLRHLVGAFGLDEL